MVHDDRTGVVLAGGYSTRFGDRDKALATVDGDPMLVRVVRRLATVTDAVVVNCRSDQRADFERVLDGAEVSVPIRFAIDDAPDRGPLAGIGVAFEGLEAAYAAVVACDMPWVDPAFLDVLFERAQGHDVAVPELEDGRLQPTQAVYRIDATLAAAADQLAADNRSLHGALDRLDVTVVSGTDVETHTDWRSLQDVNRRDEIERAERT